MEIHINFGGKVSCRRSAKEILCTKIDCRKHVFEISLSKFLAEICI